MQLRRRDVEKWMSHRRLPEDLRRFLCFQHIFFQKDKLASHFNVFPLLQSRSLTHFFFQKTKTSLACCNICCSHLLLYCLPITLIWLCFMIESLTRAHVMAMTSLKYLSLQLRKKVYLYCQKALTKYRMINQFRIDIGD